MKKLNKVILNGLQLQMRKVLIIADKIWRSNGHELVITCGLDGIHSPGSLHYYGYALDLRNRYFLDHQKETIVKILKTQLGINYDVILHKTHIHVEYQRILEI